jgi:hypothetical protein
LYICTLNISNFSPENDDDSDFEEPQVVTKGRKRQKRGDGPVSFMPFGPVTNFLLAKYFFPGQPKKAGPHFRHC